MDRKAVSGMMLTLLLIGMLKLAFNIQPAEAQTREVGVEVGDWAKYEVAYNYTSNDPTSPFYNPEFAYIEHFKTEVLFVSGTNITFRATTYFENGTEVFKVMWIDISTNVIAFPPFEWGGIPHSPSFFWGAILFTAVNLTAGDTLTPNPSSDVINATLMRTYAGAEREVNFVCRRRTSSIIRATQPKEQYIDYSTTYMFWDRATGVLVEANDTTIYYRIELDLNNHPLPGGDVYMTEIFTQMTVKETKASETSDSFIYIRADGSVDPPTAPILSVDNVTYTFTGNINTSIVVERDNIVVDGAGYTLQGTGSGTGIDLSHRINVTIKNMEIKKFWHGIVLKHAIDNTILGNTLTNNHDAIFLSYSFQNVISGSSVKSNTVWGIWFLYSSNNSVCGNVVSDNYIGIDLSRCCDSNRIYENTVTSSSCFCIGISHSLNNFIYHNNILGTLYIENTTNVWDDGIGKGNYWSLYFGVDQDGDGIGDTRFVIDENNQDNYPLMSQLGLDEVLEEEIPFWMQWWFWIIVVAGIIGLPGAVYWKKRKEPTPPVPTFP